MDRPRHPIRVIGTRHGEKQYETLLSREEMAHGRGSPGAIIASLRTARDLNYDAYFTDGSAKVCRSSTTSIRATRASSDVDEMAAILSGLPCVRECLAGERVYERLSA